MISKETRGALKVSVLERQMMLVGAAAQYAFLALRAPNLVGPAPAVSRSPAQCVMQYGDYDSYRGGGGGGGGSAYGDDNGYGGGGGGGQRDGGGGGRNRAYVREEGDTAQVDVAQV